MKRKPIACLLAAAMTVSGINQMPLGISAAETGETVQTAGEGTSSGEYNYAEFTKDELLYDFAIGQTISADSGRYTLTADSAYSEENGYGFSKVTFPNAAAGWSGSKAGSGVYSPREAVVTAGDTSYVSVTDGVLAVSSRVWTETESTGYGVYTYEETNTLDVDVDNADYEVTVEFANPTDSAYVAHFETEDITKGIDTSEKNEYGKTVQTTDISVPAGGKREVTVTAVITDGQLNMKFLADSSATSMSAAAFKTVYVDKIQITRRATEKAGEKPTIFLASDSTVQSYEKHYAPQTGWGEVLYKFFGEAVSDYEIDGCTYYQSQAYETDQVIVENRAMGGRSSASFIAEGKLDELLDDIKPGDYLFIQWGHNDATAVRPNRYVSSNDFAKYLKVYINGARQRGATPVLVTPVARYSQNADGTFKSDFAAYREVMLQLSEDMDVPLVDLTTRSIGICNSLGAADAEKLFLHVAAGEYEGAYAKGVTDNTHLQYLGAYTFAKCVAEGIKESESAQLTELQKLLDIPAEVIASVEDISMRIAVGTEDVEAALPTTAAVTFISGITKNLPITWSDIQVDTSVEGTGSAAYTIEGYEETRTITIEVVSAKKLALVSEWAFDFGPEKESDTAAAQVSASVMMPSDCGMTLSAPALGLGSALYENTADEKENHYGFTSAAESGFTSTGGPYFRDYVYGKGGSAYTFQADVRAGYYYVYVYTGCKTAENTTKFYFNDGTAAVAGPIELSGANSSQSATTAAVADGKTVYTQTSVSGSQNKYCIYQVYVPEKEEGTEEGTFSITLFDDTEGLAADAVTARLNGLEMVRYTPSEDEDDPSDDEEELASTNTRSVDTSVISNFETLKDRGLTAVNLAGSAGADVLVSATDADGNAYTSGAYLSWRSFEGDFGADNQVTTTFDVYCNDKLIADDISVTNLIYPEGKSGDVYKVVGSNDEALGIVSVDTPIWENQYLEMTLYAPEDETMPDGKTCTYTANDMSVGDVDGDGVLELIVKWYPSNAQDNSKSGYTGKTFIDTYDVNYATGKVKLLTRIDMGVNIRSGAHYTQFQVWDYDGDGAAEIAVKTADGTTTYVSSDGTDKTLTEVAYVGACNADALPVDTLSDSNDYRKDKKNGYILSGPEYFSIFNLDDGTKTAEEVEYTPVRGTSLKSVWGDDYGNRCDRFLSATAYLDGKTPYAVFCRGYYTRTCLTAYYLEKNNSADAEYESYPYTIKTYWAFDTDKDGSQYKGQGYHSLSVNDVDNDGRDEIVYGSLVIDHNGKPLYSTGLGHGDAQHISDWISWNDGLEIMSVHEETGVTYHVDVRDAKTGKILMGYYGADKDVGRGAAADIDPTAEGAEFWSIVKAEEVYTDGEPSWDSRDGAVYATTTPFTATKASVTSGDITASGEITKLADCNPAANFTLFWDGDLLSEIQDHDFDETPYVSLGAEIYKWDYENNKQVPLLSSSEILSNNGTKGNMGLVADILGDWREEIIARTSADNNKVRLYMSTIQTDYVVPCLLTNLAYREGIAWQNVAYNQPANLSYLLSEGVVTAQLKAGTVNAKDASVLFTAASDGKYGHAIEGYEIYRAKSGESFVKIAAVDADDLSVYSQDNGVTYVYKDKTVAASTGYDYKIAAIVDGKTSYMSDKLSIVTEAVKDTESTETSSSETESTENNSESTGTESTENSSESTGTESTENSSETTNSETVPSTELPSQGTTLTDTKTKTKYKVTKAGQTNGTVEYVVTTAQKVTSVTIPATVKIDGVTYKVTSIANNAFKGNKNITKVVIGANVTTIGKNAFNGCKKLKTVKIGKNVTAIKANAFKGCTALTSLTLPARVTKIGANAFSGCKKLKTLTIKSKKMTSKTLAKNAFKGLTKTTTIKVPKNKLKDYKKLFKNKGLSSKVAVKK